MTDDHEIDDIWLNALAAFPDVQPFVRLLKSTPMTPGAQDILAEMLSPNNPPIERFVLEPKLNPEFDKTLRKFSAAAEYRMKTSAGKASEIAAEEAGAKHNVTARSVFRYLAEEIPQKLGARLRGKDPEPH